MKEGHVAFFFSLLQMAFRCVVEPDKVEILFGRYSTLPSCGHFRKCTGRIREGLAGRYIRASKLETESLESGSSSTAHFEQKGEEEESPEKRPLSAQGGHHALAACGSALQHPAQLR